VLILVLILVTHAVVSNTFVIQAVGRTSEIHLILGESFSAWELAQMIYYSTSSLERVIEKGTMLK
jgi:hypothetical protein